MPKKKRKICFYYLTVNENNNLQESFKSIINHINSLPKKERIYELGNNKFCFLESYQESSGGSKNKMVIKSAKHSFRPNLVHRDTVVERENPKQIKEGEIEKSHIVMKFTSDSICFILDKHANGITVRQFINYLNQFSHRIDNEVPIRFGYEVVVKKDFLDEINKLHRVTCTEIIIDKQLLGSSALDYSNRLSQVKHDVILSVKAKNRNSIEEFAKDVFAKFAGGTREINKLRIVGRNEENNQVVINTEFIEKQEYILSEYSELTGEISSSDIFIEMNLALENFN